MRTFYWKRNNHTKKKKVTTLWLIPMSHHFVFELLSDVSSSLKALKKCPCINTRSRLLTDTIALCLLQNTKNHLAAAAAKLLQSCPTLSYPMDCSPPGCSVHRIFQARVLEWVAIAFSESPTSENLKKICLGTEASGTLRAGLTRKGIRTECSPSKPQRV